MKIRENFALKALAFLLAVAAFTGAALMAWYQIINVDVIFIPFSPSYSPGPTPLLCTGGRRD